MQTTDGKKIESAPYVHFPTLNKLRNTLKRMSLTMRNKLGNPQEITDKEML